MDLNPYQSPAHELPLDPALAVGPTESGIYAPTEAFQQPRGAVVPLLYFWATLALLSLGIVGVQLFILVQWHLGTETLQETFDVAERLAIVSQFLSPLLGLLTLIAWWRWQLRAAHNLRAFSGRHYRFTPGWTIGWHFVPILNLFKPYQAMKEIFKASDPLVLLDDESWRKSYSATVVDWWWGLWLTTSFIDAATGRLPPGSIVQYLFVSAAMLGSLSLNLTAAAMIHAIDRNQRRRANLHGAGEASALDSGHIHRL